MTKAKVLDRYTVYDYTDEDIIDNLCDRLKALRRSCCVSQQELAEKSGVSIITVKRIESGEMKDLRFGTLIKILRATGTLEGMAELIPPCPESPYLTNDKTGIARKNCSSRYKK